MCNIPAGLIGEQAPFRHADQQRLEIRHCMEQGDPLNALVPQLVAAQAAAVPDALAVMQGKLSLTYRSSGHSQSRRRLSSPRPKLPKRTLDGDAEGCKDAHFGDRAMHGRRVA